MKIIKNLKNRDFLGMDFVILIIVLLFITNSTDKVLSVYNLCEKKTKTQPTFAEIFGQGWEIDQNSNWQNDQNELNLEDSIGNDQNNEQFNDQQKYDIIQKFHAIKEGIKKNGKYSAKICNKIERKIAEKLGISRKKIYEWKKEFGLNLRNNKNYYEMKKQEFIERIHEFKRMHKNGKQKQFAKRIGHWQTTLRKWKKEFGIKLNNGFHLNDEKMSKMNEYLKMKKANPSLNDKEIAGFLKISLATLNRWKKHEFL